MEFPARAEINFRVLDGLSDLHWRVYGTSVQASQQTNGVSKSPTSTIQKEVELAMLVLRKLGYLVDTTSDGTGLWVFSNEQSFSSLNSVNAVPDDATMNEIIVETVTLYSIVTGVVPLAEIAQKLLSEPQTNLLSLLDPQNQPTINRNHVSLYSELTYSTVYKAFTSSLSGLVLLRATDRHGAIPLGKRTMFNSPESQAYAASVDGHALNSVSPPLLSSVEIEVSSKGKINMAWRTMVQEGIQQLSTDQDISNFPELSFYEDVWFAPTGTMGRYIATHKEFVQFEYKEPGVVNTESTTQTKWTIRNQREWKIAVCDWLYRFGLEPGNPEDIHWLELEILNPLPGPLGSIPGENDETINASRRVLWPANFCFKRTSPAKGDPTAGLEYFLPDTHSPLQFAKQWLQDAVSNSITLPEPEAKQPNTVEKQPTGGPTGAPGTSHGIDSLARTLTYPDFQATAMYPTPPGGAHILGTGMIAADGFGATGEYGLNDQASAETPGVNVTQPPPNMPIEPEILLSGVEATTPAVGIGSGMYDAADDDDLFGEMGGDFSDKGITEADFNFFDEPDLAEIGLDIESGGKQDLATTEDNPVSLEGTVNNVTQAGPEKDPEPSLQPKDQIMGNDTPDNIPMYREVEPSNESLNYREDSEKPPISPPLSPLEIKRILFSEKSGSSPQHTPIVKPSLLRSRSGYEPVPLQNQIRSSDKKYSLDGRYWFHDTDEVQSKSGDHVSAIPTVGMPRRSANVVRETPTDAFSRNDPKANLDQNLLSSSNSPDLSDSNESDLDDMLFYASKQPTSLAGYKRKRNPLDNELSIASPAGRLSPDMGYSIGSLSGNNDAFLASFFRHASDWTLAGYFSLNENNMTPVLCKREDIIPIAQLVADQISQSSLEYRIGSRTECYDDNSNMFLAGIIEELETLGQTHKFDLRSYVSLDDGNNAPSQQRMTQPRSNIAGSIFKLNPPHIQLRRGGSFLEILPPGISFWETFGLQPLKGEKDIIPYCLFPCNMLEGANAFLERMGLTYSSANLGDHSMPGTTNGLVPWSLSSDEKDYAAIMLKLQRVCEALGNVLSNLPTSNKNIVVYVVNPFQYSVALADICAAFLRLFHKYVGEAEKTAPRQLNELVLQIIPADFVASPHTLVIPTQAEYFRLALEVYSRCPPRDSAWDSPGCAPPLTLADPIPRIVPFKLSPDGGSPLEQGQCLHVAYSSSLDQRWVTAAWTDNPGRRQLTLSYCLRERDSTISRPISEIREDIWQTTAELVGLSHCHWRLLIVKSEPVEPEEISAWTSLARQHNQSHPSKVEITILSANNKPGVYLKIPTPPLQFNSLYQQGQGTGSTPVTTPKLNIPSPDPSTNAPTPPTISNYTAGTPSSSDPQIQTPSQQQQQQHLPSDSNGDPILIDKSDETWAVTLPHRLNNSNSLGTYRPAMASGYLIRRRGTSDTDGLASLGVNLIHSQSRLPGDMLLKDVLRMYRDLAALGRTRGIIHSQGDYSLPWHIATAVKSQEILSYIF